MHSDSLHQALQQIKSQSVASCFCDLQTELTWLLRASATQPLLEFPDVEVTTDPTVLLLDLITKPVDLNVQVQCTYQLPALPYNICSLMGGRRE